MRVEAQTAREEQRRAEQEEEGERSPPCPERLSVRGRRKRQARPGTGAATGAGPCSAAGCLAAAGCCCCGSLSASGTQPRPLPLRGEASMQMQQAHHGCVPRSACAVCVPAAPDGSWGCCSGCRAGSAKQPSRCNGKVAWPARAPSKSLRLRSSARQLRSKKAAGLSLANPLRSRHVPSPSYHHGAVPALYACGVSPCSCSSPCSGIGTELPCAAELSTRAPMAAARLLGTHTPRAAAHARHAQAAAA